MSMTDSRTVRTALLALALLAPARAQAQTRDPAVLEARAAEVQQHANRYGAAADLYLDAADARGPADPRAIENRQMAAKLLFYGGREYRAQEVMEAAAEAALAMGDVANAAHSLLDAAWIAKRTGRKGDVLTLTGRAKLLAESPLLGEDSRRSVRSRIVPS